MLFSLALILLCGFTLSGIFKKLKLPGLLGMLVSGILLGPYALNMINQSLLALSPDILKIALVVILTRAGLSIDVNDLKKIGRPAILMCFIPPALEIIGVVLLAPRLLGISIVEAAMMGAVLAAVSPAIIIPRMLSLIKQGYGTNKSIPQLIMAGSSSDSIFAIVLFSSFLGMYKGGSLNGFALLSIPISIITGILVGVLIGMILMKIFRKIHIRDTTKSLIILGICLLLVAFENFVKTFVPFSALLAIMAVSCTILKMNVALAKRISSKYSKMWVAAEVVLFILVGASININFVIGAGVPAILVIVGALILRVIGVYFSLVKSGLNAKEKFFCTVSYLPKATVQAALAAVPLSMGVAAGNIILSVAVLSIIITAPLGAVGIDLSYKKCLVKTDEV